MLVLAVLLLKLSIASGPGCSERSISSVLFLHVGVASKLCSTATAVSLQPFCCYVSLWWQACSFAAPGVMKHISGPTHKGGPGGPRPTQLS